MIPGTHWCNTGVIIRPRTRHKYMMTPKQKMDRQERLTTAHHDYEKGLNARAFFKLNNHALGEDLVQDTFIKTWKYLVRGGKD